MLGLVGLLALAAAWLIPNKEDLWISLWNESAAALGLLLLAFAASARIMHSRTPGLLAWPWAALVAIAVISTWLQWATGLLIYAGDAWLVTLYLGLFALAMLTGRALATGGQGERWATALLLAILLPGLVSAGIVLMQWIWANPLAIFAQELSSKSRPYASLGQANHANTLFFMSLCCALQLRRERAIGAPGTLLAVVLLTLAMGIAGSRTGLLQLALLAAWSIWLSRGDGESGEWRWGATAFALGLAWWLGRSELARLLYLPDWPARELGVEATSGDLRFVVWRGFLDAVWQHPWVGWGWQQTGMAQQAIIACHPQLNPYFSYTHMLALDWVVWLGLPLGLTLTVLLSWWLLGHLPKRRAAAGGYWMAAVLGLLVHSMLEYPFAYMYFLLPAGLMMGVIDARNPAHRAIRLTPKLLGSFWILLAALAALVLWDAARSESTRMEVRFENARIGAERHPVTLPNMVLLNQLGDLLQSDAADVSAPVTPDALAQQTRVAQRFPYESTLLRQAVMLADEGRQQTAAQVQQRYCDLYGAQRCADATRKWRTWQREQPALGLADFSGKPLAPRCLPVPRDPK